MKKQKIFASISDLANEFNDLHTKLKTVVNEDTEVDLCEILKITNSMITNADRQHALSKLMKN